MCKRALFISCAVIFNMLCLLCSFAAGSAQLPAVPEYKEVTRFQIKGYDSHISTLGFVEWVGDYRYQFRDWQGKIRWEVTVRPTKLAGPWHCDPVVFYPGHRIGLSPDGHYFASITTDEKITYLEIWKDGRIVATHQFPYQDDDPSLLVFNDGRVFFWGRHIAPFSSWLVKEKTILATGHFFKSAKMTPDGRAVVAPEGKRNGFRYARCRVKGKRLILSNLYHAPEALNIINADDITTQKHGTSDVWGLGDEEQEDNPIPSLFQRGLVLTSRGAIYGPKGRISKCNGWYNYTFRTDWQGLQALQTKDHETRIFSPVTGKSWKLSDSSLMGLIYDISAEARYVLVLIEAQKTESVTEPATKYELIERPGDIRAILPVKMYHNDFPMWDNMIRMGMQLSPDCKYLLVNAMLNDSSQSYRCVLFQR